MVCFLEFSNFFNSIFIHEVIEETDEDNLSPATLEARYLGEVGARGVGVNDW